MAKPRLLDLFCGAGGAGMGYHRAGFEVVGVDIKPQPRYPFEFWQRDVMDVLASWQDEEEEFLNPWVQLFDAIHASPPCQAFTSARTIHGNEHPDLLTPTRLLLEETTLPWVIENVPGAPMRPDFKLCGCMFGLDRLKRERWFETSWHGYDLRPSCSHPQPVVSVFGHGGHIYHGVDDWREVMGIDWMSRDELAQAIPPAYTEHIGHYLMAEINAKAKTKAAA